jgi:hypothetical protein
MAVQFACMYLNFHSKNEELIKLFFYLQIPYGVTISRLRTRKTKFHPTDKFCGNTNQWSLVILREFFGKKPVGYYTEESETVTPRGAFCCRGGEAFTKFFVCFSGTPNNGSYQMRTFVSCCPAGPPSAAYTSSSIHRFV